VKADLPVDLCEKLAKQLVWNVPDEEEVEERIQRKMSRDFPLDDDGSKKKD